MKKEKIIKKFKENIAETYPNKWGGYCWAFCVEDLEEIADELLTLIEQEKKEAASELLDIILSKVIYTRNDLSREYFIKLKYEDAIEIERELLRFGLKTTSVEVGL